MGQRNFARAESAMKKKRTRRETFMAHMQRVVRWVRQTAVTEPIDSTSKRVGRLSVGDTRMLCMN